MQVITKTAEAHGCGLEIDWRQPAYPPTVNDKDVTDEVERLAKELVGDKWLRLEKPSMGGEDFSFLARELCLESLLIAYSSSIPRVHHSRDNRYFQSTRR